MKNKFIKKALSVFTAMAMALSLMTGIPFSELGLGITVSAEETTPDFSAAKVLTAVDGSLYIDGVALTINTDNFGDFNVIIPEGNYKLTGNIATDIYIRTEGSINLDLNGYTWDMSGKYLFLNNNVTLSLYDTSVNKTGKITSSFVRTIYLTGSGSTFNLYSGTVENTSDNVNAYGVSSNYGNINLYGGTIKSNAYAVFYYLYSDITINIDGTVLECGNGHAQIYTSLIPSGEPCAVIDVSDYVGGALTVDAKINKAGKIKIFTGIQSAQDAENYKIIFSCDANEDFFEEKQEYEEDGGNKYVYVSVPSFTTQPTEGNLYTVAFNYPNATLQWCEVTVYDSATYSEEDGDHDKSYVVNAGDTLIVSLSECSDDFRVDFDCSYNEESLYMSLDSSRKTASVTFDSACSVNVNVMLSPYGTGEYKIEHVRCTELEGENGVQLSKTECETTYVCKATVGEREYYSDIVTKEHSCTCTATSDNVITAECANCGKSGTLTIAYGATVIKTGILENEEVTVNYYQGDISIGTDAPVDAGTYTAKITYEDVTASVTFTITGAFEVTGGTEGVDYTYENGVLTINTSTALTIKNTDPSTPTTDRIEVASGVSANITLAGVNIDVSATENTAAFKIADNSTGNVTITLADGTTNTLKSGKYCAGLQKNGGTSTGMLTIQGETAGTGVLNAIGADYGAGIGGDKNSSGCNITISGGIVTAQCDDEVGAGIGGGEWGSGRNITISGGTVTVQGGSDSAGIGGGILGYGSNIEISGGSVKVVAGYGAPAIGDGRAYGGAVTPTDGTNDVYLLELTVDGTSAVTINGSTNYPKKHFEENKLYVYLPAKTAQAPNEVTIGSTTTKYTYDTTNSKWLTVVDAPEADINKFTCNGVELTYTLAESDYYTISGNKQTNAGTYTVTVSLKENTVWSDGTTDDKEYPFTITYTDADNNGICDHCGFYVEPELEDEYYQIANAGNLMWFASQVNEGQTTINAKLTADIDMKDIDWTAMNVFAGTFDGNGYTISNLCADEDGGDDDIADGSRCGLIQTLSEGGKVTGLTISGAQLWSAHSAGAIAAVNYGTISKCIVKDSSIMLGASHGLSAIAGTNTGTVTDCGAINCFLQRRWGAANSSDYAIGVIVEDNSGTVSNCFSYGCKFSNSPNAYAIVESGNAPVNCYYYTDATVSDTVATAKTKEQFASGEVAYLLNGEKTDGTQTWYQTIDTDAYPISDSTHKTVYKQTVCGEATIVYRNVNEPVHVYTHTVVPPTYYEEGYTLHECDNCDYSYKDNFTDMLALVKPVLSATAGDKQATLSWTAVEGASYYQIIRYNKGAYSVVATIKSTSAVVKGLTNDFEYTYLINAVAEDGRTSLSTAIYVTPKGEIAKPVLSATAGDKQATLSWTAVEGASYYQIIRYKAGAYSLIANISGTSAVVKGLTNNFEYTYLIKVTMTDGTVIYSNAVNVTPVAELAKPVLSATAGDKQVTLSWTAVEGASYYQIIRYNKGTYSVVATIKSTSAVVKGLTNDFEYTYLIKAVAEDGRFSLSTAIYVTPKGETAKPVLSAIAGDKQATLSWTAVEGASYYQIIRYKAGEYSLIANISGTSAVVKGLTNNFEYTYLIKATMTDGTVVYSNAVSVTPKA